jgi:hypothetical protein
MPFRSPVRVLLAALLAASPASAQPADPDELPVEDAEEAAVPTPGADTVPDADPPPVPPPGDPADPGGDLDDPFEGPVVEVDPPFDPDEPDEGDRPGPTAVPDEPGEDPIDEGDGDDAIDERHVVRYYLEGFEFEGNSRTREETILRWMSMREGETFRADDPRIDHSRAALLATGFFEEVRFSLRRGSRRGWVIFQVRVRERWTLLIDSLAYGYTGITGFGGLGITEMNLLGTGSRLSAAFAAADAQQAYRLHFVDPAFLGSEWSLQAGATVHDARDYLGFHGVNAVHGDGSVEEDHATVDYWRAGGTLGTGRRITRRLRLDMAYRFEWIKADLPLAATELRGTGGSEVRRPVALDLLQDESLLSIVEAGLTYDTRDDPFLPLSGTRLHVGIDLSHDVFGSDYTYARITLDHETHFPLPWEHTLTLRTFFGIITGKAPLFEQFFVGDFSDFIPGRVLGLNFHDFPTHNLFGTTIGEMQYEDIAAKVEVEYLLPLHRSRTGFLYGVDLYFSIGLFSLSSVTDVALQLPGYGRASLFPIDFTSDLGIRIDTMIGLFHFGVSNALGFVPWE